MTLVLDTTAEFCRQVGGDDSKFDVHSECFNKPFCVYPKWTENTV